MRALLVALTACALATPTFAQQEKVVPASDKQTQISVPADWEVLELNDAAELQVGSAKSEAYLIVLNELKDDMYGWNLEKHSRVTLGNLLSTLAFPTVVGPKALKIGESPAIQYEIRGAADSRNVIYLHTTVDGPKYFSQILAWTLPSRAETVRPQLLKAINTFREAD